ncbi:MFS transporter [Tessaracoccus sp. G1721]
MTIWTRTFVLATVVNFLVSLVFFMLMVTMATYAAESFAASDATAGLAASIFIIGAFVVRPFAGRFLDAVGRRRMLLVGLGVFTVASFLYVPADNLGLLLAVRMLHGAGMGASHTAISASIMTVLPPARRSEGMGYFTLSGTVATAIGPVISLTVLRLGSITWLFGLGAVLSTAALLLALGLRFPGPVRHVEVAGHAGDRAHGRMGGFMERSVLPIASMMLLLGIAFTGVLTYVSTHAAALDLTAALSGFFLVYSGVIAVSRLFVGRLHDVRGDNVIVYPALVSMAAGMVVLALASSGIALLVAGGLLGLGMGTLQSSAHVIAVSVAPLHRVGLATSTLFIMMDLGVGLGPLALGPVIAQWGLPTMYLGLSALVVAAGVVYHLGHGRGPRVSRPAQTVEA